MRTQTLTTLIFSVMSFTTWALEPSIPLQVWTNEAIINLYTFSDKNWTDRQQDMATYFYPDAWKTYLAAMHQSNILKLVTEKHMTVAAVATLPPNIKTIDSTHFSAIMPVLVSYTNQNFTQTQNLTVQLDIIKSSESTTRGYAITQFHATIDSSPCTCQSPPTKSKVTIV